MSKSALKNKPASQLTVIPIHPVTWDVVEVNKKVEGLGGNWDNINPYDIYQESTFLMLTNRVLQARWQYDVVSKVTYQGEDGEHTALLVAVNINLMNQLYSKKALTFSWTN